LDEILGVAVSVGLWGSKGNVWKKSFEGSKFLGGNSGVCGAICHEWYPLFEREIFYLEMFWTFFRSNRVNTAQVGLAL